MRWRWDQGRLPYFQFENICRMANVLCGIDGISLRTREDLLRRPLETYTELPFAPAHYKVWRNYARVFQCAMLATEIDGKLIVTDVCRRLTSNAPFTPDEYLNFVFSHFRLPYPAFNDYDAGLTPAYPFVAILKFMIARQGRPVTLDDVFRFVIGNDCTGTESISYYKSLMPTPRLPLGDEQRQVREMLVFMGQASYIRWFDRHLYLDTENFDAILSATTPYASPTRNPDPGKEFFLLTSLKAYPSLENFEIELSERNVSEFAVREGKRAFASHSKIERSPLLRERFFRLHQDAACDACHLHPRDKYPWLDSHNILELHHILPLSATLNVNGTTTTLDDLRPLCPTCHRSIHIFYKNKLNEWDLPDFSSKKMATDVYELAKRTIIN